ncbi:MAG: hypothetical protein AAGD25_30490 [Cyanobacteria bacterium P01_F01_bin.150]
MSLSSRLKKKLKAKFRKQRSKTKGPNPNKNRTKTRDSKPDSPNRKPDSDPKTLTSADRQTLIRDIDNDIKTAKKLPPADASKLLRAAHTLKRGLLDLDAKRNNNNNQIDSEKKDKEKDTNPTDLKKARNELTQAKDNLQDTATNIRESAIATATAFKKKPEDMSADDISDAIDAVENAIKDGQTNLLTADASKWQRAMYALKMALFELADVDPQLAVKDKDKLKELIETKRTNATTDPATSAKVRKAIADANKVQADIPLRQTDSQPQKPPGNQDLERLQDKQSEDMSADEIIQSIAAVDKAIEKGQTDLLPADAGKWQKVLRTLQLALFELGGVDPELAVKDRDKLIDQIATKQSKPLTDNTRKKIEQAIADVNRVQSDINNRPPTPIDYKALEKLKDTPPEDMTADDIVQAIAAVDKAIEEGQTDLLPADAGKWQKVLRALKLALFELGGVDPDLAVKDRNELIELIATKQGQPLTDDTRDKIERAIADVNRTQSEINSQPSKTLDYPALAKLKDTLPEDMSADEIIEAIAAVEQAIEAGKNDLLPADASTWQKVLHTLRMALFELGGVNPDLTVQNREELLDLIATKQGRPPTAETRETVEKAIADMTRVQSDIVRQTSSTSEYPALDILKQKKPADLSIKELNDAIKDIDRSIEAGKTLLPEDASPWLRAFYALKMALFELGGIDPKLHYDLQDQLKTLQQDREESPQPLPSPTPATISKVTRAINTVKQVQATIIHPD